MWRTHYEFLKVIRNGLCAATDEITLGEMIAEINSEAETPFRWLTHWLAARYQMPGYVTQTNLWFCGSRGTGKGSLVSVLRQVFGARAIGKIDSSDINRGWSDSLFSADIVEWDEFKSGGWHDLNRFIKEKTGNETYTVTKRNIGSTEQPFVAGQIMTTNDSHPMFVEADDRQNCFISTTQSTEWKARAKALWNPMTNELHERSTARGFAAILNDIDIDFDFIRRPLDTKLRNKLVGYFADDSVEQWIEHVVDEKMPFECPSWSDLHNEYRAYTQAHASSKPKDLKTFKQYLLDNDLARDAIGKTRGGDRKSFRYARLLACSPVIEIAA